jgi:hypothetical protein
MAMRVGVALVAAAATAVASLATAQDWSVQSGAAARVEYNDNYFFTPVGTQSAFTGSITPFITAAHHTDASDVTALVAVGANQVWGLSPTVNYVSGNFTLNGSVHDAHSVWTGSASFVRSANLENATGQAGTALVLAFTNAAAVGGTYTYAVTERWSLGATASAYNNTYDGVESGATISNNRGYGAGGNVGYAYSDHTQFTFVARYLYYASNITHSDAVTTTLGVVHQFSPQLTVSASAGGFWSDTEVVQNNLPATGSRVRDSGGLYGGSISYAFSERTQFGVYLSENLVPSGSGILSKSDNAGLSLTHQFSDRLTGRLGAGYTRTVIPVTISSSTTDNYYSGEVGLSYQLAERWKLDAGYRYSRATYGQTPGEPTSNLVFLSLGYNWPGQSFTDWVGRSPNTQGLPGAGPVSLPDNIRGTTARQPDSSPERSPFDPFTLP